VSMKNSIDDVGNRTRDFPAFSVVFHPTASPRGIPMNTADNITMDVKHGDRVMEFGINQNVGNFFCYVSCG
jgi:hypothetical protein